MSDEAAKTPAEEAGEIKEKTRALMALEPVETRHQLDARGRSMQYTAHAGVLPLKDEAGEIEAEIFFTAYTLDGVEDPASRPVTFAFNGGPGSASIWLHMGALGPKRVTMEPEGWMPQPPFRYEDNAHTWLDQTDLVFIDPVGTGYSRAAKESLDKKFMGYKGDIESVGEFIRLYLTRHRRWMSPLFLAGESYGTTRAAALAGHLVDRGIALSGILLISTALDFQSIRFVAANDLPFQLFLPTYAATAWYHDRLTEHLQTRSVQDLVEEVATWATRTLTSALAEGDRLGDTERNAVASQLAEYTGLPLEYVLGTNMRVNIHHFCKELLRREKRSVGRLDSRFQGVEAHVANESPEFDPSMVAIDPPYSAAFNHYVREELGVETDRVYETLSRKVNEAWEWEKGIMPATGEILRSAMAKNPYMRVYVGQGIYDLATPLLATRYMISHMNVDPVLRGNLSIFHYASGHMFYLDTGCLAAFRQDVDAFLRLCCCG